MDLNGDGKFDGSDYLLQEEFFGDNTGNNDSSGIESGDVGCLPWVIIILIFWWLIDIIFF